MFHLPLSFSLVLFGARLLAAATIQANALTSVNASWGLPPGSPGFQPSGSFNSPMCQDTRDQSASCKSSYYLDLTDTLGVSHSLDAMATATTTTTYGSISVTASVSPIDMPSGFRGYGQAQAWGSFSDRITIYSTAAHGVLVSSWNLPRQTPPGPIQVQYGTIIAWTSGVSVPIDAMIGIGTENGAKVLGWPSALSLNLTLLDMKVYLDGSSPSSQLLGFYYSTESGTPYNVIGGTLVPEPSSLALVGAGMLLLYHRSRRAQLTGS